MNGFQIRRVNNRCVIIMGSCLLQNIAYSEYKEATTLPLQMCEVIAKLSGLKIQFNKSTKLCGEVLINELDKRGVSAKKYREYLKAAQTSKVVHTYYKPNTKVAVLIANDKYETLSKLATPCHDCDLLCNELKKLNFLVVTIKNCKSNDLKIILGMIFRVVPENSYSFVFYAGHGCEICNTKFMLDIMCPPEGITMNHCVTENYILQQVARSKPELCILIMDMCRLQLDRTTNPQIYDSLPSMETYTIDNINNLLISYSTQSSSAAYEVLQIECSHTIDNNVTYELKTDDMERIVPGASQYVNALCARFQDDLDVSSFLDKVHGDVEHSMKKQRPIKIQCGVAKRSLYDPVKGDTTELRIKLQKLCQTYSEYCHLF